MRNQYKCRCDRSDQNVLEFQTVGHLTDFITVHTFGGRGSPLF